MFTKLDIVYFTDSGHVVGAVARTGPSAALDDGVDRLETLVGSSLVISTSDATALEQGQFALRREWLSHVELDMDDAIADVLLRPLDWIVKLPPPGTEPAPPPTEILLATRPIDALAWNAAADTFTASFPDGSGGDPPPTADSEIVFVVSEGTTTRRIDRRYILGQDAYETTPVASPVACLVLAAGGFKAMLELGT